MSLRPWPEKPACDRCGTVAPSSPWPDGWSWYGRYRIVGHGAGAGEVAQVKFIACSPECAKVLAAEHGVEGATA